MYKIKPVCAATASLNISNQCLYNYDKHIGTDKKPINYLIDPALRQYVDKVYGTDQRAKRILHGLPFELENKYSGSALEVHANIQAALEDIANDAANYKLAQAQLNTEFSIKKFRARYALQPASVSADVTPTIDKRLNVAVTFGKEQLGSKKESNGDRWVSNNAPFSGTTLVGTTSYHYDVKNDYAPTTLGIAMADMVNDYLVQYVPEFITPSREELEAELEDLIAKYEDLSTQIKSFCNYPRQHFTALYAFRKMYDDAVDQCPDLIDDLYDIYQEELANLRAYVSTFSTEQVAIHDRIAQLRFILGEESHGNIQDLVAVKALGFDML
jgi:hypothetical protein